MTFPAELHRKLAVVVVEQSYDEFRDLNAHVELIADRTQTIWHSEKAITNRQPSNGTLDFTYQDHLKQLEVQYIVPLLSAHHVPNQRKTPTKRQQSTPS